MKTLAIACCALLLTGCAVPVIDTTLPANWKSVQRYGTGTNLSANWANANVKYLPGEETKEMQRDRNGLQF